MSLLKYCSSFCVLICASSHSLVIAQTDSPSSATATIQSQLRAAEKDHQESLKQAALKKAELEVEQTRAANLEKQLQDVKQRIEKGRKAVDATTVRQVAGQKKMAQLKQTLEAHQNVDKLAAAATAAESQLHDARRNLDSLNQQISKAQTEIASVDGTEATAATALQRATQQLPLKNQDLTDARKTLDEVSREVDGAKLRVTEARDELKKAQSAVRPELSRVVQAKSAVQNIAEEIKGLQDSLTALQAAAKAAGVDGKAAGTELTQTLAAVKSLQTRATQLVNVANSRVQSAQAHADAAQKVLANAQTMLRAKQDQYAASSRTHFLLQLSVSNLQNAEKLHQDQVAEAKQRREQLVKVLAELTPQKMTAESAIAKLEAAVIEKQRVAQAAMKPLNRFVSFSEHVAPILVRRCVACHNDRTARGRLDMDSFVALARGGKSGPVIRAHDASGSLLLSKIEDGSMPHDADPLAKEEIALIRKWIEVGAPLDAGVVASADLLQIIPEMPQPLPPATYRVPIPVTATAFNADATILATSGYHEVLLWKTQDGSLLRRITNVAERVYDLTFTADGSQLLVAAGSPGQLGEVKLFSTADGRHLKTLLRSPDAIFAVSLSPDQKQIAAGGADHLLHVVDVATAETIQTFEQHSDWVMDVRWSRDSTKIVSASRDKSAIVFDVAGGKALVKFDGHGEEINTAAFLQDGKRVVSAGNDRHARIWNIADGKEIRKIGGFGSDIFQLVVTPDDHLLTSCGDRNAREHTLADGTEVRTFAGHKDWVYTLSYNADKHLVATGSYDGEIRVWNSQDGSVATSFIAVPKASDKATVAIAK